MQHYISLSDLGSTLLQTLCLVSLQDAQAGRNVIECLLRYLGKGGHWADTSSLRSIAIGITRKVHPCLSPQAA